jgi:murein hydrolase activator
MLPLLLALAAATPEARLADLERQVRAQEIRLATQQAPLTALLARVEEIALRPPALALANARSAVDLVRTRALLSALQPAIATQTAALRRQMIATSAARATLAQAVSERAEARMRFGDLQQAALNRRLAALPAPAQTSRPSGASPAYRLPAAGQVVIGTGDRTDTGVTAQGLTLATAAGAPVVAPATGRVVYAGPFSGYGDIVLIDQGGGWATLLAGLSLATGERGERLAPGTLVGRMGNEHPRLTVELRHHGRAIDVAGMAARRQ